MRKTYARADTTVAFRHLFDFRTLDAEGDGFAMAATEVGFSPSLSFGVSGALGGSQAGSSAAPL